MSQSQGPQVLMQGERQRRILSAPYQADGLLVTSESLAQSDPGCDATAPSRRASAPGGAGKSRSWTAVRPAAKHSCAAVNSPRHSSSCPAWLGEFRRQAPIANLLRALARLLGWRRARRSTVHAFAGLWRRLPALWRAVVAAPRGSLSAPPLVAAVQTAAHGGLGGTATVRLPAATTRRCPRCQQFVRPRGRCR